MMYKYFVFFMLWAVCSCHLHLAPPTCEEKAMYKSHLTLAADMIKKAKYVITKDRIPKALDCADVLQMGGNKSGIYEIWPVSRLTDGNKPLSVYCDMETNGGGWTVIQRRGDFQRPKDYFNQDWETYKKGFGDINKDFWLGNDNIFALTNQKPYSVRFDMKDFDQNEKYALYDRFWIDDEVHNYTLHIWDYCGDAGDSMIYHDNKAFSTKDIDNDIEERGSCAEKFKGGWWYFDCYKVNLNGLHRRPKDKEAGGIIWANFKALNESMEWTEIKIRRKDFTVAATELTCHPHDTV